MRSSSATLSNPDRPQELSGPSRARTVLSVEWRVRNSVTSEDAPVAAWADAARTRLSDVGAVRRADIRGSFDGEDPDDVPTLEVDVTVRASDPSDAGRVVMDAVLGALEDVSGQTEIGWSSYTWHGVPAGET
jgi:hypothetical protein